MSDREGVAIRIPEVGNLGAPLERGDALLVRYDRPFVVALEGDALRGELVYNHLDVSAGGPYQSFTYARQKALKLAAGSGARVWRVHTRAGTDSYEDVSDQ